MVKKLLSSVIGLVVMLVVIGIAGVDGVSRPRHPNRWPQLRNHRARRRAPVQCPPVR